MTNSKPAWGITRQVVPRDFPSQLPSVWRFRLRNHIIDMAYKFAARLPDDVVVALHNQEGLITLRLDPSFATLTNLESEV